MSAAEVNQFDFAGGAAEKAGAEALELLNGIGSEATDLVLRGRRSFLRSLPAEEAHGGVGSGFGGVDNLHASRDRSIQERAQQRIVGAAEDQRVWVKALSGSLGVEFSEIDADHFCCNRHLLCGSHLRLGRSGLRRTGYRAGPSGDGPALLDQRDEQRAGFFQGTKAHGAAGGGVGVALDGGAGGNDQHVAGARGLAGGGGAGLDDAQNGDGHGVLNGVQSQGAGGVAGDHQELCTLLADEELSALGGVAGDGAAGLGAVGQAGRVAEKGELSPRQPLDKRAQDGQAAEAGVEDADGGGDGANGPNIARVTGSGPHNLPPVM